MNLFVRLCLIRVSLYLILCTFFVKFIKHVFCNLLRNVIIKMHTKFYLYTWLKFKLFSIARIHNNNENILKY